jgi:hypothetical protein
MKAQHGVAGYFMHVANLLTHSRFVHSQDIHTQKRTLTDGFLRGDVLFTDGSRLHFRELITYFPLPPERGLATETE